MDKASVLFHTSVGLFVNTDQATARQLGERDIQREIENVQWQLNALARSYLRSSITFFREGVLHLFKLRNKGSDEEDYTKTEHFGAGIQNKCKQVEVYSVSSTNPICDVSRGLKDLKLTNLNDANRRALQDAKKNFEEARKKAVDAFNNDALSASDRIQAMVIRVSAAMLLNVDHPEDALEVCILCLEELHSLPEVQESFSRHLKKGFKNPFKNDRKQIITSVCRINHAIRNAAVMIAKEGELLTFPSIESGGEKIDPLHDHRVADILRKLEMPQYSITPITIGEKNENKKPKIPQGITVNSQGHFIVGDEWEQTVKVFDRSGFLRQLPIDKEKTIGSISDVTTDREDNVYVLVKQEKRFKIIVFDLEGNWKHEFFLKGKTAEVLRMTVNNSSEVLVLAENSEKHARSVVEVYKSNGDIVRSFGEETLNSAQDICTTSDGRVIVLDRDDQCVLSVQVFHPNGQYIEDLFESVKKAEKPIAKLRSSIACHQVSNSVVIAVPSEISKNRKDAPVRILKYELEEKQLISSIDLPMKGLVSTRGVTVTVGGRIAVGLLDKSGGDSKVLVV